MPSDDVFEELKPKGFIRDYSDWVLEGVPSQRDWVELNAMTLLSQGVGGAPYIMTYIGPLHLNLFGIDIGPSGLAHKTTPLDYYAIPVLMEFSNKLGESAILPSRFSIEGMIEYFVTKRSEGIIIRDEVTTLFKESQKSYLNDILEFLSELYDGKLQKRYTKKAKLEEIKGVCVSFLGATTSYLYSVFNPRQWFGQGTGNRFLYVTYKNKTPRQYTGEELFLGHGSYERWEKKEEFAERLFKLNEVLTEKWNRAIAERYYFFTVEPEASNILARYKYQKEREAERLHKENPMNLEYSYIVRCPEFAFKISALHCVSRSEKRFVEYKPDTLMVSNYDSRWAIYKVEEHLKHYYNVHKNWFVLGKQKQSYFFAEDFEAIIEIIKEYGGKATWTELLLKTGWTSPTGREKLIGLLDPLIKSGKLTEKDGKGSSKGGPKPKLYFLTNSVS